MIRIWLVSALICLLSLIGLSSDTTANVTGEKVIIRLSTLATSEDISFIESLGGKVKHTYHMVPGMAVEVPISQLSKITRHGNVKSIEPDRIVTVFDAELDSSWGVKQIGAGLVQASGNSGSGKVAVIDTGVDYTHPELAGAYHGGFDFVNNDADPMDDHGHGTHCAGIIAASDDNAGVVGVAPSIELYSVKVMDSTGSGYWSTIIAGIEWCVTNGMQITSNSYGGYAVPGQLVEETFQAAYDAGVLTVAAAGNNGGWETLDKTSYPARYTSVLAVAATDANKVHAQFSSTGPATEVSAPGVDIYSTYLNGTYATMSGTSMACPHVAGLAALVKGAHPDWDNATIRGQIRATADDLGAPGHDWLYGYGLVNAVKSVGALVPDVPSMPPVPPLPPPVDVRTYNPTDITSNSAVFHGELLSIGSSPSIDCWFQYGTGSGPGKETLPEVLSAPRSFSANALGLTPDTWYYVSAYCWSFYTSEWDSGAALSFQTLPGPTVTPTPLPTPTGTPAPTRTPRPKHTPKGPKK